MFLLKIIFIYSGSLCCNIENLVTDQFICQSVYLCEDDSGIQGYRQKRVYLQS